MIIDNASVRDLLALASEIAHTERLDLRTAMKQAIRMWPTLPMDARQSAGMPTGMRVQRRRTQGRRNAWAA